MKTLIPFPFEKVFSFYTNQPTINECKPCATKVISVKNYFVDFIERYPIILENIFPYLNKKDFTNFSKALYRSGNTMNVTSYEDLKDLAWTHYCSRERLRPCYRHLNSDILLDNLERYDKSLSLKLSLTDTFFHIKKVNNKRVAIVFNLLHKDMSFDSRVLLREINSLLGEHGLNKEFECDYDYNSEYNARDGFTRLEQSLIITHHLTKDVKTTSLFFNLVLKGLGNIQTQEFKIVNKMLLAKVAERLLEFLKKECTSVNGKKNKNLDNLTSSHIDSIFSNCAELKKTDSILEDFYRSSSVPKSTFVKHPTIVHKIASFLPNKTDYTNFRQALMSEGIEPCILSFDELKIALRNSNNKIDSLEPTYQSLYHALLIDQNEDEFLKAVVGKIIGNITVRNCYLSVLDGRRARAILLNYGNYNDVTNMNFVGEIGKLIHRIPFVHPDYLTQPILTGFRKSGDPQIKIADFIVGINIEWIGDEKKTDAFFDYITKVGHEIYKCSDRINIIKLLYTMSFIKLIEFFKTERLHHFNKSFIAKINEQYPYLTDLNEALRYGLPTRDA